MSIIIKVIILGFCIAFINPLMRKNSPEFVLLISAGGTIVFFSLIYEYFKDAVIKLREITEYAGISGEYGGLILKIIAVAYICEYSASAIEDCGEKAAANKIELAGKIVIFIMTFPLLSSLFEAVSAFITK